MTDDEQTPELVKRKKQPDSMAIVALTHNLQKYWIVHQAVPRTVSQ